jgi:preprotein translocase subunit SecD
MAGSLSSIRPCIDKRTKEYNIMTRRQNKGRSKMKKNTLLISMILVSFSIGFAQTQSDNPRTGFYLIAAQADSAAALPAPGAGQQVIHYDYKYLRDTERGKSRYLLLSKIADVPLILAGQPELQLKGENGFPELRLELTPEAANKLEKLTSEHLGSTVAFMIDGEPVTIHKIRSAITGGQFRISRCTDTACQYIYGRLVEKR